VSRWRRTVPRFTAAESFQQFVEALRTFQGYQDEAARRPLRLSRQVLDRTLDDAEYLLARCVTEYPDDVLPRYYYGIVLGTQAQTAQARQLEDDLVRRAAEISGGSALAPSEAPTLGLGVSRQAELLYQKSAAEFRAAAMNAPRELSVFAKYNQAQALSKEAQALSLRPAGSVANIRKLSEDALSILHGLSPFSERLARRLAFKPSSRAAGLAGRRTWRLGRLRRPARPSASTPELGATTSDAVAERNAARYQVSMLIEFISSWQSAIDGKLTLGDFPDDGVDRLKPHAMEILLEAREDMQVDYWIKWAQVARTWAQRNPGDVRAELLARAHRYYARLRDLDRGGWAPALLNEAFVFALEGRDDRARENLNAILGGGDVPVEPSPPVEATPDLEAIQMYILEMPLGTPAVTVAHLVNAAFGALDPSLVQALVRVLDHARLKMEFIEEIVDALETTPPVDE
jgi:hypothetical protein